MKRFDFLIVLIDLILVGLMYYLTLPPINVTSMEFWSFIFTIWMIVFVSMAIRDSNRIIVRKKFNFKLLNTYKYLFIVLAVLVLGIGLVDFSLSPLFNAKSYSKRIEIDSTGVFVEDVKEVDFTKIPLIDKDSSRKLGDRKMGEFTSWVSQFYVND